MDDSLKNEHFEEIGGEAFSLSETYYILSDGTKLTCAFDCGIRGDDHRIIFSILEDIEYNDWDSLHEKYGIVRFVPESMYALIKKGQKLTTEQRNILTSANITVEEY